MKTIEERAREYVLNAIPIIEPSPIIRQFRAYTAGATKQKAIDIEKACEWLERANSALPPCYKMFEVNIENFRKAMEG